MQKWYIEEGAWLVYLYSCLDNRRGWSSWTWLHKQMFKGKKDGTSFFPSVVLPHLHPHLPLLIPFHSTISFIHLHLLSQSTVTSAPTMTKTDKPRVLIVGGGLAGLFLGGLLERSGVPYIIFERAASVKPVGMVPGLRLSMQAVLRMQCIHLHFHKWTWHRSTHSSYFPPSFAR